MPVTVIAQRPNMPIEILRIATRKSPLALWQALHVSEALKQHWPSLKTELIPLVTSGDKFLKDNLQAIGGKGLFVKELEEALLAKRADIAVHSMKDVPAVFPDGLSLAAICKRDNPLDAFIAKQPTSLQRLPAGSIIGTSSLRRQSQLLAFRPDCKIKTLRGNINTRLDKLVSGEFDAIILAAAGLERLSLQAYIKEVLDENCMLPACGQGALGIEYRSEDSLIKRLLTPLNDPLTTTCVQSERLVSLRLGGNCQVPLAVFCRPLPNEQLLLQAKVLSPDGQKMIYDSQTGPISQAINLATACSENLLIKGADKLLGLHS